MVRAEPGSWMNQAVGLGLDGPVSPDVVDELIEYYTEKGIEPRIEHAPYADKALTQALEKAGFRVRNFETIFCRSLAGAGEISAPRVPPAGLTIERVDPSDDAMVNLYAKTAVGGFFPPDFVVPDSYVESVVRMVRHPRTISVAAWLDGAMVGAGAMEIVGEMSALFGMSTKEGYRRRGIQQAVIAYRLNLAREHGAKLATIGARPGIPTERNVQRMGFMAAYTKVALVRPGEGLTPNLE